MRNAQRKVSYKFMILMAFVLGTVLHKTWLPLLVLPLTRADQPVDADCLLFLRSVKAADEAYSFAAQFARAHSDRRILVFRDYVRRAEQIGADVSFIETTVAMLNDRGIPSSQIEVIGDGSAITSGEVMSTVTDWLAKQPSPKSMMVVTHRLRSGYVQDVVRRNVPKTVRSQLCVVGFPKKQIDENNWWKTRSGIKLMIREYLRLAHLWVLGDRRPNTDWDPDEFEQSLKRQAGHA